MSVASDRDARRLARTRFDRPLVLEAGAGTGKTTALVARVVAWLVDEGFERARATSRDDDLAAVRALDGLLAITFTEAAAADMDAKIRAALALVEGGGTPIGMEEHVFASAPVERSRRAGLLRIALERPVAQTIHSWCQTLLKQHPLEAGLHPGFEVDPHGRAALEVVRAVVTGDLRERLADAPNPDWLLLAYRNVGPGSVEGAIVHLLLEGRRAEDLAEESFPDIWLADLECALRAAIESFLAVCPDLPVKADAKSKPRSVHVRAALTAILPALHASKSSATEVSGHARALAETLSKTAREGLSDWALGSVNKTEAKVCDDGGAGLMEQAKALEPQLMRFIALDPELERAARHVIVRILQRARLELVRRGIETFGDLLRDARDLLERDRDLCARLRNRLDQVLVDEFQDTDPLQCDLVRFIALDPTRGRTPGLLLVGDPKQSIYGFRRADLAAYDAFLDEVLAHGGERAHLTVNFRSGQGILDHVESVVAPHMQPVAGVQPAFVALQAHRANAPSTIEWWNARDTQLVEGATPVKTSAAAGNRLEAGFLAAELRASHERGVDWGDMAVLMRTGTALDVLLEALRDAGIPFDVAGDKSYYKRREILDAAAVFACVVDPGDHVALLAYLRSPWVGVPDALLIPLWRESFAAAAGDLDARVARTLTEARAIVSRALADMPRDVPRLDRIQGFEAALDHGLETLAELRASWQRDPADVFLERARLLLLCEATAAARFQGIHRLANLERFFDEIALELESNGGDAQAVLRYVRAAINDSSDAADARPRDAAASAVPIMTIHKSKGLDFREVFVVGLQRPGRGNAAARSNTRIESEGHILFGAPSPGWHDHEVRKEVRESAERVRLLYVAMTRAKDRLVLSGIWSAPPKEGRRTPTALLHLMEEQLPQSAREHFATCASDALALEVDGVVYRVTPVSELADTRGGTHERFDVSRVQSDSDRLASARATAHARQDHALIVPMSSSRAPDDEDELDQALVRTPRRRMSAGVPAIAGTAMHRALEALPLDGDLASAMQSSRASLAALVAQVAVEQSAPHAHVPEALALALSVHDAFVAGPAFAHFRSVAAHVVARELPIMASTTFADGLATLANGAIDLVYRDAATNELVVVDYKSGPESESGADDRHRAQVQVYRRSLQHALALDRLPRGELWYLASSRVVNLA